MANIELRHMKAFIVLATFQHFGKAAEHLNTAQPQLSRLLKHIEDEVGVSLVDRTTRQFKLTMAGEEFLEMARKTIQYSEDAVLNARAVGKGDLGTIRIGYMDFAMNRIVPACLRAFQNRNPYVKVELEHLCTERQRLALMENTLDIGFLIGPFIQKDVSSIEISSRRLMVYLPDTHPMAHKSIIDLKDLAGDDFIFGKMQHWRPFRGHVERECLGNGFIPHVSHEPFNSDGIFGLISAGLGITIYPERESRLNPRGIVMKPLRGVEGEVKVVASWKKDSPSTIVAEFLDVIRQRVVASRS